MTRRTAWSTSNNPARRWPNWPRCAVWSGRPSPPTNPSGGQQIPARVALAGAADIAVIKVAPLGGVRAALRIAQAAGLPVVVSSAVDTSVGLAAGLALAAALPELPYACGLGTASLLTADVTSSELQPIDGFIEVPQRAPTADLLAGVQADAATTQFWLERLHRVAALI